jgi:hypothetical protein
MKLFLNAILLISMLAVTGCETTYYKTMETFGKHKRDILVSNVTETRDIQQETKEQFKSALEKFTDVVNFKGGKLKEKYDLLSAELETSEKKAKAMRNHIDDVANVAEDLFKEWEKELDQYTSENLRHASAVKLDQTKKSYQKLIAAMRKAEEKIAPVLAAFRDQVLFLKHNLNAQAIASLQDELVTIENDIAVLIKEMEASIEEANEFIKAMGVS